jgi:hypothetical protein
VKQYTGENREEALEVTQLVNAACRKDVKTLPKSDFDIDSILNRESTILL